MGHEFAERHVVVTGGTGALGGAVVGALLSRGAVCHVPSFSERSLTSFPYREDARVRLTAGVDLSDEASAAGFFETVPQLWASVHIAGGFSAARILDTRLEDFQRMMTLNAQTCFLCCREAVRALRRQGGGGRIVNVAARAALVPTGGMVAYAASKAAVIGVTHSLADELVEEDIWVNAVAPSIMDTPKNRAAMPKADPAGWPSVGDVAEAILFLASPANRITWGAVLPVYGRAG